METTLGELRWKEVIGITDGTRYGYVGDILFDGDSGQVKALIVPGKPRFFGLFGFQEERIFLWDSIQRLGEDIILVEGIPTVKPQPDRKRKKA